MSVLNHVRPPPTGRYFHCVRQNSRYTQSEMHGLIFRKRMEPVTLMLRLKGYLSDHPKLNVWVDPPCRNDCVCVCVYVIFPLCCMKLLVSWAPDSLLLLLTSDPCACVHHFSLSFPLAPCFSIFLSLSFLTFYVSHSSLSL